MGEESIGMFFFEEDKYEALKFFKLEEQFFLRLFVVFLLKKEKSFDNSSLAFSSPFFNKSLAFRILPN